MYKVTGVLGGIVILRFFLVSAFLSQLCFAGDITVTVYCNGNSVDDLQITVVDSENRPVDGATWTDQNGQFTIANSEDYTAPFYLFFTARDGSTCGAYPVIIYDAMRGDVQLAYYPTILPCSCAHCLDR